MQSCLSLQQANELGSKKTIWRPGTHFYTIMETLIYNSISIFRVTFSQYGKAFGLPATSVALVVPGANTLDDNHRFKSLLYTKAFVK